MGSRNKYQGVLKLFVCTYKLLKTFHSVLLRIDCVIHNIDYSSPFDFLFIVLVCEGLVIMRKRQVFKISVVLFQLIIYFSIVYWLNLDSLPVLVLFVGAIFFKRHNLFQNLFSGWISVDELVVNDRVVVLSVDCGVLAAKHIHFGL